jgi:hypothetical protein
MPDRQKYIVRVTKSGTDAAPYGWVIVRETDDHEAARSSRTFVTRTEALIDSARAAAALTYDVGPEPQG